MKAAEDSSEVTSRLKKRLERVLAQNFKAGTDVEPLVAELLSALKTYEANRG